MHDRGEAWYTETTTTTDRDAVLHQLWKDVYVTCLMKGITAPDAKCGASGAVKAFKEEFGWE